MAYATYITDALVCGVKDSKTSDRTYLLFTRDAGMLFASARSVREERSKQRHALQEFSHVRVTLIKGKVGWRIGSVEAKNNFYHSATDKSARGSVVKMFRFLRRFIQGEESAGELFDFALGALHLVSRKTENRAFLDVVVKVRVLNLLGYVSSKTVSEKLIMTPLAEVGLFSEDLRVEADKVLQKAAEASHL